MQPAAGSSPYHADLAFDHLVSDRDAAHCRAHADTRSRIVDLADGHLLSTAADVDARNTLTVPSFVAGVEGWRARRWLNADALQRLAALGVGEIRWRVRDSKYARAREIARSLNADRRPRVDVVSPRRTLPWLVLKKAPQGAPGQSLADDLKALVGERRWTAISDLPAPAIFDKLWGPAVDAPALRPDAPASLVRLGPAEEGELNLQTARILGIWIDGIKIGGAAK